MKLSEEQELPQPRANALILLGWALAWSGDTAEGIVKLEEGLGFMKRVGVRPFLPRSLCLMAEALTVAGRCAEGLERVTRALDIAAETGDVCYVPQLHQTRAELLLHTHGRDEEAVEVSLRQALVVAREQGAKGYELRAATRLAHLWARARLPKRSSRTPRARLCLVHRGILHRRPERGKGAGGTEPT